MKYYEYKVEDVCSWAIDERSLTSKMNELGKQGWELITKITSKSNGHDWYKLIFKREIDQTGKPV